MLRILFFLAVVFALGLGFAWLADRPGDLVVTFGGYQYQVTLMVAAVGVAAIVAATMLLWWIVKGIWRSPYLVSRYFRVRRRDRGYQALSTGMIAAGAGDAALARKKKKEAMKLISADQEPLIHLLDAQASLLEGDHEAARRKFEAMLADPEMRMLGLRGLYLEAERLGDRTAARHYAARAVEAAPQLGWAAEVSLEEKAEAHEWDEALRLVEAQKSTVQIERDAAARRRAVLLTAKALDTLEADPTGAKAAALEAHKLAPALVPAAVAAARAAFRLGDVRKGAKVLEAAWKQEPHPEIADAYVHARPGDSTHDRLDRAKKLQALKRNHAESALAVARAALDAGEFALARREAEAAALDDLFDADVGGLGEVEAEFAGVGLGDVFEEFAAALLPGGAFGGGGGVCQEDDVEAAETLGEGLALVAFGCSEAVGELLGDEAVHAEAFHVGLDGVVGGGGRPARPGRGRVLPLRRCRASDQRQRWLVPADAGRDRGRGHAGGGLRPCARPPHRALQLLRRHRGHGGGGRAHPPLARLRPSFSPVAARLRQPTSR